MFIFSYAILTNKRCLYIGVIADLRENQLVDNIPTGDDFSRDPLLEKMIGSVVTQEYVIDT